MIKFEIIDFPTGLAQRIQEGLNELTANAIANAFALHPSGFMDKQTSTHASAVEHKWPRPTVDRGVLESLFVLWVNRWLDRELDIWYRSHLMYMAYMRARYPRYDSPKN